MNHRILLAPVAAAALSLISTAVSAEVRLNLEACAQSGVPNANCDAYTNTQPFGTHIQNGITFHGSSASGFADLASGTLRATAHSANDTIGRATTAISVLGDNVTFSGGFGQTAYLDYHFQGSITEAINPIANNISFGGLQIYMANPLATTRNDGLALATAGGCSVLGGFANLGCHEGSTIDLRGSVPFQLMAGDFYFLSSLSATATSGDHVDFGNSAHFSFRLPDGVTYTSRTGEFLTGPVAAVPEPESVFLLCAGLAALGWRHAAHRRRSQRLARAQATELVSPPNT